MHGNELFSLCRCRCLELAVAVQLLLKDGYKSSGSCQKSTFGFWGRILNRQNILGSGGSDLKVVEKKHEQGVLTCACPVPAVL